MYPVPADDVPLSDDEIDRRLPARKVLGNGHRSDVRVAKRHFAEPRSPIRGKIAFIRVVAFGASAAPA
jgi:hypothetical protein